MEASRTVVTQLDILSRRTLLCTLATCVALGVIAAYTPMWMAEMIYERPAAGGDHVDMVGNSCATNPDGSAMTLRSQCWQGVCAPRLLHAVSDMAL